MYKNLTLLMVIMILSGVTATISGQNGSIFKPSTKTQATLDSNQYVRYTKFSTSPSYLSHRLIEVESLVAKQNGGKIALILPNFQCSNLVFSAKKVEYSNENNYYWFGIITTENDNACFEGTITLMASNGEKFGHVLIDSTVYEFNELGGGVQLLSEVDDSRFSTPDCGIDETTPNYSSNSDTTARITPCIGECDVKVLFTSLKPH